MGFGCGGNVGGGCGGSSGSFILFLVLILLVFGMGFIGCGGIC